MLQAETVVRLVLMVCVIVTLSAACGPEAEDLTSGALASCQYINGFSGERECKEYLGSNWSDARMRADCDLPVPGSDPGDLVAGQECDRSSLQGICAVEPGTVEASNIVFSSTTASTCDELSLGCFFASGEWLPSEPCGGEAAPIP